ncbi:MAG: pitrilysin family protein [Gemmatimonadota bacterium]
MSRSERPGTLQLDERVYRTDLPDGLVVLSEDVPGVRSVAAGIWVRWGASHDPAEVMGISHLIEHMVFKGTEKRSARQIALEIEGIGGTLDAYTTREHTAYYARVLEEHLPIALDVLADLVSAPLFRDQDLAVEKQVVLEEIAGVEDTPEDLVFELHARALWGDHAYGNPVLGTAETVKAIGCADLQRFWQAAYRPSGLVIAVAGKVRHEELLDLVMRALPKDSGSDDAPGVPEPTAESPGDVGYSRESAQAHICLGSPIFAHNDKRRYAANLLSMSLGGGMSSRLFQRVREELGLAYAVYTFQSFYSSAGVSGVYVATRPETAALARDEVLNELASIATAGLMDTELEAVKNQAKGQIMLSLESTSSRLHRLAAMPIYDEPFRTLDELSSLIDAVSVEEVAELSRTYYAPERQTIVRLGPDAEKGLVAATLQ